MNVAALAADVTERPALSEPFQTKEARPRVVHRDCTFKELRSTAMVAFQLTIIDRHFLRLISHAYRGRPSSSWWHPTISRLVI